MKTYDLIVIGAGPAGVSGARLAAMRNKTVALINPDKKLGGAGVNTGPARELSAKLASLKGIVWVGVVMFLFGLASIFYPPLQAIIGSVTTSAAILVGGLALMILPSLVVGNELLILAGVASAVGLWFLAHRHGQLRGLVDAAEAALVAPPDNPGKAGGA